MDKYRTIIFDLDGTLFKRDEIFIEILNKICIEKGLKVWDKNKLGELIGKPIKHIYQLLFGDQITEEEIESIRREVRLEEENLAGKLGMLYEGVVEILDKLKNEGYTLCICTKGSEIYTNRLLKAFGIKDKFSIINQE